MPSILDDPGKIIIMAGDFSISKELNFNQKQQSIESIMCKEEVDQYFFALNK